LRITPFFSVMTVSFSPAVTHFTAAETSNQYKPQVSHKFFGSGYGGQAFHDCPWPGLSMTVNKKHSNKEQY